MLISGIGFYNEVGYLVIGKANGNYITRQAKGAFDFISKPFKPQDLQEVIDRAAKEIN